jgi:hypothetical protein
MEFWRTDEIAPVVLIILFELMVLGPDQLHDADLMSVVECGCTHSGSASRQDWPGYCLFILAWFPPSLRFLSLVWSHNSLRAARSGAFLYSTLIPPAALPRA